MMIVQRLLRLLGEMELQPDSVQVAYCRAPEMEAQELIQTMSPIAFWYFIKRLGSESEHYR